MVLMLLTLITVLLLAIGDVCFAYAYIVHANLRPNDPVGFLAVEIPLVCGVILCFLGVVAGLTGLFMNSIRTRKRLSWTLTILIVIHAIPLLYSVLWVSRNA